MNLSVVIILNFEAVQSELPVVTTVVTVTVNTAINAHFNIYLVELPTSASESIVEVTKLQNTTLEPSDIAMPQALDTSCTKPSGMLSCSPMCLPMTYYQS